jgi:hypothetical protein
MKCFRPFFIGSLILLSVFIAIPAHAQELSLDPFEVLMNPDTPQPGKPVSLEVKSFTADVHELSFTWSADGAVVASGIGVAKYEFIAPANGKKVTVRVQATNPRGPSLNKSFIIAPAEVNLLWEAQTYTPPFYKGHSHYTHQSFMRFIAMPNFKDKNGVRIDPKTLIYTWKKDEQTLGPRSGYGKQTISLQGDILQNSYTITVDVTNPTNTLSGSASLRVESEDPQAILYTEDPLYGIQYQRAIGNSESIRGEKTLLVEPYFFNIIDNDSVGNISPSLEYHWMVNYTERPDLMHERHITFKPKKDTEGIANIDITILNTSEILQRVKESMRLSFEAAPEPEAAPLFTP